MDREDERDIRDKISHLITQLITGLSAYFSIDDAELYSHAGK
jgi:hypothetical protein